MVCQKTNLQIRSTATEQNDPVNVFYADKGKQLTISELGVPSSTN